jgi:2-polyprenyl-3-methyl-5-hydroxy-6-metoxy-1,4-benzoquinol methylase
MSDLHKYYQEVYSKNKNEHFLKYRDGQKLATEHKIALDWIEELSLSTGNILDFGCGEGDFLSECRMPEKFGIDYSDQAIANANSKYDTIQFVLGSESQLSHYVGQFDIITSFGTLEHLVNPQETVLKLISCLKPEGILITSCPSFLNVRGIIWMTLVKLFNVPMSLSDKHFISPSDLTQWLQNSGKQINRMVSVDIEVAQGDYFSNDMSKRLTNALSDADMDHSKVPLLIEWVNSNLSLFACDEYTGANMIYLIR